MPSHLYLRFNTYYFRQAVPVDLRSIVGRQEIRLSLRTGGKSKARLAARKISALLSDLIQFIRGMILMGYKDEVKAQMDTLLRDMLAEAEASLVDTNAAVKPRPGMYPNSLYNLQEHLAKTRYSHDEHGSKDKRESVEMKPRCTQDIRDANWEKVLTDNPAINYLLCAFESKETMCNRPYFIDEWYENLQRDYINTPESPEEWAVFAHEFTKMAISFYQIMNHRDAGDYNYEKTVVPPEPLNVVAYKRTSSQLLLSEVIKRYTDDKIQSGAWNRTSPDTAVPALENLVDVLGDVSITDIDRSMMRRFRDVMLQLPPNRKKDDRYCDLTVNEILEQLKSRNPIRKGETRLRKETYRQSSILLAIKKTACV